MKVLTSLVAGLTAVVCLAATMAAAQSPATSAADAERAKQQQQRQLTQPLNNQPLWSEVRSGAPQTTTVVGRETNVLIQPEGQTWRAARTRSFRDRRCRHWRNGRFGNATLRSADC